ncbi:MAG: MATE family efflux transporter [Clostridia bacterium]|nr:MATE family efflux transporter [Clostridia bacterium]
MKVRDMTEGSPVRLIMLVALPLMLGNVCQQLYTVVDAAVVGRGIGMDALAALGSSDWFNWMWLSIAQGLTQGFAIPIAQAFGAKDYAALRRCVGGAASLTALLAALLTGAALLAIHPVLALLGTPAEILPTGAAYLTVLFAGLPVVMAYNLLAGILRGFGDARSPLMAMALSSAVNIGLDILFVMGFGLGVTGAAAATVIAQGCSAAFCLLRLRGLDFLRLKRADFRLTRAQASSLMKLGVPVSMQNALISVGGMIVQTVVNALGVAFIAGYTATNKLYGLLELAAVSYGYALSTYAGQNYGAGQYQRVRRGVRAGAATGALTAAGISLAMFALGRPVLGLFIDPAAGTGEAMEAACEYLYTMSACLPVLYVLYVVRSTLHGIGDTLTPMLSGMAEFAMRTGSALLLPRWIGYRGVFAAEVLAWAGADVILIAGWMRAKRKRLPLTDRTTQRSGI